MVTSWRPGAGAGDGTGRLTEYLHGTKRGPLVPWPLWVGSAPQGHIPDQVAVPSAWLSSLGSSPESSPLKGSPK